MKRAALALAAVLALPASALDIEIGGGQTKWSKPPQTQYWQNGFDNAWDLRSPAIYVGITDASSHSPAWFNGYSNGLRWRVGLIDFGTVKGQAHATSDDANVAPYQCYDMSRCRPEDLSVWYTHGRTRGLELSLSPEWAVGSVKFGVKVGALAHFPSVKVRIWRDDNDPDRKRYDYITRLNVAPTIGVSASYGKATFTVSCYKINAGSRGEQAPSVDVDSISLQQNWDDRMCGTVVAMGMWRF